MSEQPRDSRHDDDDAEVHTKLYAHTACLSIQQTLIFKTDKKSLCEFTKSVYMFLQIKYQPNITNGGGMI